MRFLIECTYVYEHPQDNSGIQRVVRNIVNNLNKLDTAAVCVPVILKNDKVYSVTQLSPLRGQGLRSRAQAWLSLQHGRLARLRNRIWLAYGQRERKWPFHHSPVLRFFLRMIYKAFSFCFAVPQKLLAYVSLNYVDSHSTFQLYF